MEILFSLVTLAGMGYAVFIGVKWMLKAGQQAGKREQPLAPTDLKVLEESATRLMADLRAAADECVSRVELAVAQAESRLRQADQQSAFGVALRDQIDPTSLETLQRSNVSTLERSESAAQIARQSGMTTGEVELLRGLRQISTSAGMLQR